MNPSNVCLIDDAMPESDLFVAGVNAQTRALLFRDAGVAAGAVVDDWTGVRRLAIACHGAPGGSRRRSCATTATWRASSRRAAHN
jgi:hypothetical protein